MEIKPTDLRIGNYVSCSTHGNLNVTCIEENCIGLEITENNSIYLEFDEIELIPLTEEWLVNFDFYKGKKFYSDGRIYLEYSNEGGFKFSLFPEEDENDVVQYASTPMGAQTIHYVHQLQNLYWAITGEEITLNTELLKQTI